MKNSQKKKRLIFVGSIFAISLLSLAFVVDNFRDNMVFFYSPSDLRSSAKLSRNIRVGGLVVENSVKKIDALTTKFTITDNVENLEIEYVGILPDLFRENQGVVAKGKFDEEKNQFFSRELLIKHDENYMPPEVAKSLKKK